jgi:class 3 adenylate cyclase
MKSRTATIMFTDIYGFTQMSEFEGRRRLVEIVSGLHTLIEAVVRESDGKVIKSIGDSLMVIFDSPTAAVLSAIEIQRRNKRRNGTLPQADRVEIRVGINTGEVTEIENDVYGEAVNVASRVEGECEPGGVYFTEATFLAMNRDKVVCSPAGRRALKGLTYVVKLYKVPVEEFNDAVVSKRSPSFFGLLSRDADNRPLIMLPAPAATRVVSGVLDIWISFALVILFLVYLHYRPMVAWVSDAIRIEAEGLGASSPLPCTTYAAVNDFIRHIVGELGGGRYTHFETSNPLVTQRSFFSCGQGLRLGEPGKFETQFRGPAGHYDVIVTVLYNLRTDVREFNGDLRIGMFRHDFIRRMHPGEPERFVAGRNLALNPGDPVILEARENSGGWMEVDFIEFLPVASVAKRPWGNPLSWRFYEFYEMLDYDEMNVHFFFYRFPIGYFLTIFFSYLLFGRTLGNIIMGCYVVNNKGKGIHVGQCLLRAVALLFHPFWILFYMKQDRMFTDIISGTKVVIPRRRT